jgi:hypothetical protein
MDVQIANKMGFKKMYGVSVHIAYETNFISGAPSGT